MSGERRRFAVTMTVPDWGQDHLSPDVIVAYVDSELADRPFGRATRHLSECPECAAQVRAQGQARSALRSAECPSLSSSLLSSLRSIPQDTELPGPPISLAMTADGELVTVQRHERYPAPRGGADVPGEGRVDIRVDAAAHPLAPPPAVPGRRPAMPRRIKLGAGAAVSGLALGALAFGAPGVVSASPSPSPGADRGVFNGPVLGGGSGAVDARLRLDKAARLDLPEGLARIPGSFLGLH